MGRGSQLLERGKDLVCLRASVGRGRRIDLVPLHGSDKGRFVSTMHDRNITRSDSSEYSGPSCATNNGSGSSGSCPSGVQTIVWSFERSVRLLTKVSTIVP
jgi:hypothetical protein